MRKFAYNNAKNASNDHIFFELNYGYHLYVFYKKNINSYSKSKLVKELLSELQEFMSVYCENLYHAQKLQKRAYNRDPKPKNYVSSDKVWLNSKYIKTK